VEWRGIEPAETSAAVADQLPGGERRAADIVGTDIIHKRDIRLTVDAHHRDLLRNALVHQRFRRLPGGDDNPGDAKLGETAQGAGQILLAANFAHQRLKTATLDLAKQSIKQAAAKRIADARDDHANQMAARRFSPWARKLT
jgi:hypothetical protein